MDVRPKKSLGQHFLKDANIARKIAEAVSSNMPFVLEIGPGKGILTQPLLERFGTRLMAVEVDEEAHSYLLENKLIDTEHLILADILSTGLDRFHENKMALVGNLPYNISSPIFFMVLENRHRIDEVVCMIQKEVAVRIAEPPGTKSYGILSVLLQAYYDIEYLFTVNEQVFSPPPKVKSAVIRLKRNSVKALDCDEPLFFKVVKIAFNQRRKMLRNSLSGFMGVRNLPLAYHEKRPEQLSVADFITITRAISLQ